MEYELWIKLKKGKKEAFTAAAMADLRRLWFVCNHLTETPEQAATLLVNGWKSILQTGEQAKEAPGESLSTLFFTAVLPQLQKDVAPLADVSGLKRPKLPKAYDALVHNLDSLQPLDRQIYLLHEICGVPKRQTAALTGTEEETVKTTLKACQVRLYNRKNDSDPQFAAAVRLVSALKSPDAGAFSDIRVPNPVLAQLAPKMVQHEQKREAAARKAAAKAKMPRKKLYAILAVVLVAIAGFCCGFAAYQSTQPSPNDTVEINFTPTTYAKIQVQNYGTIQLALNAEAAPLTVENFVKLANDGFYNGLTFHRIMNGFMMQGGDPDGNGTGGSGETITGEFWANGVMNPMSHTRGVISMARSKEMNSASSQFFICQADSTHLDGQYAAFGSVVRGMDVVDKICRDAKPIDDNGTIARSQQPIITSVTIVDSLD